MTKFGMPLFLEDKSGSLTGSEYTDLYNRARLVLRCTLRTPARAAYMVYDLAERADPRSGLPVPAACLDFGPADALGSVKIRDGEHVPMGQYLTKLSPLGSSKNRKFVASDGQEYRWAHQAGQDDEWVCRNASNYHIASYTLKAAGEPKYTGSSGCALTIEEDYAHLAPELLASLTIMRHIAKYNL
ncbi:hypothetical protein CERSUDRAFT_117905 [Gelatoporia subvermispora B]|uniref:DUF6593 domain-containing protein n=1 Tax=Ceriporiopsis subvermispora (strain B) TaxID=914234 RepID=M2R4K5_CERS8|nr:hypothetical protein CERSUDRAFT_117904 [Gelatoporia subvermispora B]EMD33841.1 hypothetical protein CERSUDRAFT_117905 [Gelatoporia subvermispora B]